MAPRRIYFANISNVFPILPLQWGVLRAAAETDPRVAAAYRFEEPFFLPRRAAAMARQVRRPAVLAVSCWVWNFQLQMKLCRLVKRRHPRCVVVAGGCQIPRRPGEFFERHPHVDVLVHGEGEGPFRRLLVELLEARPQLEAVGGISFNRGGEAVCGGPNREPLPVRITDAELPSPYLAGYYERILRRTRRRVPRLWALWETSRGCPHECAFCDYGAAEHGRLKRFERARVKAELDYLAAHRVDLVFCADANFGLLRRDVELSRHVAATRRRTGYPAQFKANFAQRSGERIVAVARELHRAGLLVAGLTLAPQSATPAVAAACGRTGPGAALRREVKRRCDAEGIPSYVDTILGLPLETRDSWLRGACALLAEGHDDVRLFELYLLPNARLGEAAARRRYGLQTVPKRLNLHLPPDETGVVELVRATGTLSGADWVDCAAFSHLVVSTLHCGGYTRYLARHLAARGLLDHEAFYLPLFEHAAARPDTVLGAVLRRLRRLLDDLLRDPEIPVQGQVATQADMLAFLLPYSSPRKFVWWPHDWAWLVLNRDLDGLYAQLRSVLRAAGLDPREPELADLLAFQRDQPLTPDFDPRAGKRGRYRHDWPRCFFGDGELAARPVEVWYRDRVMGLQRQHPLRRGDRSAFALAACGNYYPDGKARRFVHQPDAMQTRPRG